MPAVEGAGQVVLVQRGLCGVERSVRGASHGPLAQSHLPRLFVGECLVDVELGGRCVLPKVQCPRPWLPGAVSSPQYLLQPPFQAISTQWSNLRGNIFVFGLKLLDNFVFNIS
jgi:hypothetical protein